MILASDNRNAGIGDTKKNSRKKSPGNVRDLRRDLDKIKGTVWRIPPQSLTFGVTTLVRKYVTSAFIPLRRKKKEEIERERNQLRVRS